MYFTCNFKLKYFSTTQIFSGNEDGNGGDGSGGCGGHGWFKGEGDSGGDQKW